MKIEVLAGAQDFARVVASPPWRPFDVRVINFLSALSDRLMKHPLVKVHIDTMGVAYFCRRSNLEAFRARFASTIDSALGRGLSFHIAPSNVPINFAYSLLLGLLTGNTCIVRASSKDFAETTIVCDGIRELLCEDRFSEFGDRISVIRYERDRETNDLLSSMCEVRLIWGGDQTVAEIRKSPLPPRAVDVVFADRYSACVIDAKGYLGVVDKRSLAIGFYNDTYRNHQAACTAPRLVYWLGDHDSVKSGQAAFWGELDSVLTAKGEECSAIETVEKFTAACRLTLAQPQARMIRDNRPRICRIQVSSLAQTLPLHVCGGGFFVEYHSERLDALRSMVTAKIQTITYIGIASEQIARDVAFAGVKGVDRVVPNGKASEFDLFWDGYDLVVSLTRHITVT